MTLQEKVFALNRSFQILYFDNDLTFFEYTIPKKLDEIESIINTNIPNKFSKSSTIDAHFKEIQKMREDALEYVNLKNKIQSVRDNYLVNLKLNFNSMCHHFLYNVWQYDANLPDQVI